MGTMPVSSGRGEGVVGGIVRFVESDGAVRSVTTSVVVWAIAGRSDRRKKSKKRAPQDGGLFWERGGSDFRICKQRQLLLRSCMTPSFVRSEPHPKDSEYKVS